MRLKMTTRLGAWAAALLAVGCLSEGDKRPRPPETAPSRQNNAVFGTGPCADWATRACAIEVGTHDAFIDCAPGVQVCENGSWRGCAVDASREHVSVPAPLASRGSPSEVGLLAVGGSSTSCSDNVCNPYCQLYEDEPDDPIEADRIDTPTGTLYGGSLQSSNVPSSFKTKGSLDSQCGNAPGSDSWNSACQFDQHCVDGECVAFEPSESGSCVGIDLTTPTTCVPSSGGKRAITVCNRGSTSAPAGIKCYRYPGGSPQYPNDNPGIGTLVMTTAGAIEAGECETQQVPEATWGQNGIQSVGCNPPQSVVLTVSVGPSYPSGASSTSGTLAWTSPTSAGASDSVEASATPANPTAASTGALYPSANGTFSTDSVWLNPQSAYSSTPSGTYASAAPAAPSVASGSLGPAYPALYTTPASSGETSFTNPQRANAADSSYTTTTPANPSTTVAGTASANDASASWSNLNLAYITGTPALYATATRTSAGTSDGTLSGYTFNLPSNAILDSLQLTAKWKTNLHNTKYTLSAQALTGAASTAIGSSLLKSGTYTTETTDTLTIAAAALSAFYPSDFSDANFKVRLRFARANGGVADSTASVDYVQATLTYHVPNNTASVVYRSFGLGSVPDDAAVQLTASVKWKTGAVNTNFNLGLQVYADYGAATQSAVGSELTRAALDTLDHVDATPALC